MKLVSTLTAKDRRRLEALRDAPAKLDARRTRTIRELRANGAGVREIAAVLDVAPSTVLAWQQRATDD